MTGEKPAVDVRLGALAVEWGLLSRDELETLAGNASHGRVPSRRRLLGEALVRERYASPEIVLELLDEQRRRRFRRAPAAPAVPQEGDLERWIGAAITTGAQELLIVPARPPGLRIADTLRPLSEPPVAAERVESVAGALLGAAAEGASLVKTLVLAGRRFRTVLARSEQGPSLSLRAVGLLPRQDGLSLPEALAPLALLKRGLVVVAGAQPSIRASVLAKLLDELNDRSRRHVIAIDRAPIYEHESRQALIAQRVVGVHTKSYETALRAALREDPDVLAIGELGEPEAIATALLSAETGHLVVVSLHAADATQAIRRLVDIQSAAKLSLVRATVANTLQAVVIASVVEGKAGRHLLADILPGTPAVQRVVREGRLHQLEAAARTQAGAVSRDDQLRALLAAGRISRLAALGAARDPAALDGGAA